jgi:flagellin-like protein
MDRRGISNVVATIILIAVAIALAVAVAVWVFGLAGSASKTASLQVQAVGLTGVSSGSSATLTLLISNPSSSGIGINGFTLGSLSCVFSSPVQVPAGTQGGQLTITLTISSKGTFYSVPSNGVTGSGGVTVPSSITVSCNGNQTAAVGIQYSGYLTTVSGQTYPFTVTASS